VNTVNVDELFVSWLQAQQPAWGVASERPATLGQTLPFVVIRRGGGGDNAPWVDGPVVYVDCYAADWSTVGTVARAVDSLFRERTPTGWRGAQFTLLRCNQAPIKVSDANTAVRHMASIYTFSLQ
jgi:hypothetical protein